MKTYEVYIEKVNTKEMARIKSLKVTMNTKHNLTYTVMNGVNINEIKVDGINTNIIMANTINANTSNPVVFHLC